MNSKIDPASIRPLRELNAGISGKDGRHTDTEVSFARRSMRCKIFLHYSGSRLTKHAAIPQRARLIRSQKRKNPDVLASGRLITAEFEWPVECERRVR